MGPGDEVITVPNTFIATAEAISFCGARPVFVDVDPETCTLNPWLLPAAVTDRTRAIIPVHLYGQPADMDPIMATARHYGLPVIEDAAQAHGAEYRGIRAGAIGDLGCFSFYPGKNLGAWGEAGAVVTSRRDLADRIRMLRDHGQSSKYHHERIGWNSRMDGLQAAVLEVKLKYLDEANQARRRHAAQYRRELSGLAAVRLPEEAPYAHHIYHVFAVTLDHRDACRERMETLGIHCGIHYPVPIHLQPAYRDLGYAEGAFPMAEHSSRHCLSLPLYPQLTPDQIDAVARGLLIATKESAELVA